MSKSSPVAFQRHLRLLLWVLWVALSSGQCDALKRPIRELAKAPAMALHLLNPRGRGTKMSWMDKRVKKIFDDADSNKDGTVTRQEVYELVLKFYIKVNQKGPIPPPSREKIEYLYQQCDSDRNGRLDHDEFRRLMYTVFQRASTRLATFKAISVVCAPIMAISLVNFLKGEPYLRELCDVVLPDNTPERLIRILTTESVWTTLFTVILVNNLGKFALSVVDRLNWGHDDKFYSKVMTLADE